MFLLLFASLLWTPTGPSFVCLLDLFNDGIVDLIAAISWHHIVTGAVHRDIVDADSDVLMMSRCRILMMMMIMMIRWSVQWIIHAACYITRSAINSSRRSSIRHMWLDDTAFWWMTNGEQRHLMTSYTITSGFWNKDQIVNSLQKATLSCLSLFWCTERLKVSNNFKTWLLLSFVLFRYCLLTQNIQGICFNDQNVSTEEITHLIYDELVFQEDICYSPYVI